MTVLRVAAGTHLDSLKPSHLHSPLGAVPGDGRSPGSLATEERSWSVGLRTLMLEADPPVGQPDAAGFMARRDAWSSPSGLPRAIAEMKSPSVGEDIGSTSLIVFADVVANAGAHQFTISRARATLGQKR